MQPTLQLEYCKILSDSPVEKTPYSNVH